MKGALKRGSKRRGNAEDETDDEVEVAVNLPQGP